MVLPHVLDKNKPALVYNENISVTFVEPLIERAAANHLGKEIGTITQKDLQSLTTLLLFGDEPFNYWDEVICNGRSRGEGVNYHMVYDPHHQSVHNPGNVSSLEDLRKMPNLRMLALYRQNITDLSPLEGLPITHLALGDNPVSDFSVLSSLEMLYDVNMSATNLSDASVLAGCSNLQSVRLYDANVFDLTPLQGLPINKLWVTYDNISANPQALQNFPSLTELRIDYLPASGGEIIANIKTLRSLCLRWFQGTTLDLIVSLTSLSFIEVHNSSLESLEGFEALTSLNHLSLIDSNVRDLSPLFGLKNLAYLNIVGIPLDDDTQVLSIPGLNELAVSSGRVEYYNSLGGILKAISAD